MIPLTFSPTFNLSIGKGKNSKASDDQPKELKAEAALPAVASAAPSQAQAFVLHIDAFQALLGGIVLALILVSAAALIHELRA